MSEASWYFQVVEPYVGSPSPVLQEHGPFESEAEARMALTALQLGYPMGRLLEFLGVYQKPL